jgi:UDP-N-acetylglucosamine 2-epimerase (non-hydrolysing)
MGARKLVIHVVGARPNYMKIAPAYTHLDRTGEVRQKLVHTGQHYDAIVNDVFFRDLPLPRPHVRLEVGSGPHGEQTGRALSELERVFVDLRPDLVVVPGDVNSTLAAALAAVKLHIPVCHVEAGLRSFDWTMPEEHNRRLTDHVSTLLLTHCEDANENLAREGIDPARVSFVGNTLIDTLFANVRRARALASWRRYGLRHGRYVVVTLHLPRLVDDSALLEQTMRSLEVVARKVPVIFPVHPRTRQRLANADLDEPNGAVLVPPLPYREFLSLETGASAVVTDSGGVQEETTALGIPCFTLRENTERPVTVTHGTNVLCGLDPSRLEEIPAHIRRPRRCAMPPLWDGLAGRRAADEIRRALGLATIERARTAVGTPAGGRAD